MVEKIYGCYGAVRINGLSLEESFKRYGILYRIGKFSNFNPEIKNEMDFPGKRLEKQIVGEMKFQKIEGKNSLEDVYFEKGFPSF